MSVLGICYRTRLGIAPCLSGFAREPSDFGEHANRASSELYRTQIQKKNTPFRLRCMPSLQPPATASETQPPRADLLSTSAAARSPPSPRRAPPVWHRGGQDDSIDGENGGRKGLPSQTLSPDRTPHTNPRTHLKLHSAMVGIEKGRRRCPPPPKQTHTPHPGLRTLPHNVPCTSSFSRPLMRVWYSISLRVRDALMSSSSCGPKKNRRAAKGKRGEKQNCD